MQIIFKKINFCMDISSIYEVDSADWAENLRGSKRENTRQSSLFGARRISSLWEVTVKVTLKMGVKDPTHPNTELLFTRYVFWDHLLNHASKILYFHCMITDLITELALNKACAVFFVFFPYPNRPPPPSGSWPPHRRSFTSHTRYTR